MSTADARSNQRAELAHQFAQIIDLEVGVVLDAARRLLVIDNFLERIRIVLVLRLQLEHDVAEHLAEAPVRVPREARVAADPLEPLHRLVGEPEVQHRVHHPRHRNARARSHRHQQRILGVAELAPERLLDPRDALRDALGQPLRIFVRVIVKVVADLRRDRESRRHRQLEPRHLGQVRALAAQQVAHLGAPFRHARAEKVNLRMNPSHVNSLLPRRIEIVRRQFLILARPADSLCDHFDQPRARHPLLRHRVAIADRHRVVFHRLMIDRHAVRRADFILTPIAPPDRSRLIVGDREMPLQRVANRDRFFRLSRPCAAADRPRP